MKAKKIFITGGSGVLGTKLTACLAKDHNVFAPTSKECNILDTKMLKSILVNFSPDIVIHLAAFVDTFGCEDNIKKALDVNVLGTMNIVKICSEIKCKFIYTSTEYVFGGDKGNYSVDDRLDPLNVYGKTKAASEYIVSLLDDYKIIRAPFIKRVYGEVFTDQYCSRYFLGDVVGKVIDNIFSNSKGIIHIANDRTSLYNLYKEKGIVATPITMPKKFESIIPKDTSLINNGI